MQNPYLSLLSTAWKYARKERRLFLTVYAMFVFANIVIAINPLFYGWFVNTLQKGGVEVLAHGWIYVLGFLGLRLAEWCFHGPARVMERRLAFQLSQNFIEDLYHKVVFLPVSWHQHNHSGATISKVQKSYIALRDFFQNGFIYIHSFGKFVFSFAAMLYFSPLFGAIGVALGVITIFIIRKFDKPFIKTLKEVNGKEHEVSSALFDSLSNIITVITLRLEDRIKHGIFARVRQVFQPFMRNVVINEWKWFCAQMLVGLIYAVITIGYLHQNYVPGETFYLGGLVILLGYVNQFTSVFNDIASQYTQIVKYHTEVQNVEEIEKTFEAVAKMRREHPVPPQWKMLEISNLNFVRGEDTDRIHKTGLENISIRLRKGERIAVIGESGSGKSTLMALLRGLYKPEETVEVVADGQIKVSYESLAPGVTLLPQDPEIFEETLLYNITLGLPYSENEVMEACCAVHFDQVVNQLPNGLHTHIQEKGVNLSGGQKQRLALARGILAARSSDIILMDEPTSSVDPKTEKFIYQNLFNAFSNKAVVSTLHRLHLLTGFDYVYIMRQGAIVDEGTYDELQRYSLVFKELSAERKSEEEISADLSIPDHDTRAVSL